MLLLVTQAALQYDTGTPPQYEGLSACNTDGRPGRQGHTHPRCQRNVWMVGGVSESMMTPRPHESHFLQRSLFLCLTVGAAAIVAVVTLPSTTWQTRLTPGRATIAIAQFSLYSEVLYKEADKQAYRRGQARAGRQAGKQTNKQTGRQGRPAITRRNDRGMKHTRY